MEQKRNDGSALQNCKGQHYEWTTADVPHLYLGGPLRERAPFKTGLVQVKMNQKITLPLSIRQKLQQLVMPLGGTQYCQCVKCCDMKTCMLIKFMSPCRKHLNTERTHLILGDLSSNYTKTLKPFTSFQI